MKITEPVIKRIILVSYDQKDALDHIRRNKLNFSEVIIVTEANKLFGLGKGMRLIVTDIAYINRNYNEIIGQLQLRGYSVKR